MLQLRSISPEEGRGTISVCWGLIDVEVELQMELSSSPLTETPSGNQGSILQVELAGVMVLSSVLQNCLLGNVWNL